MHVGREPTFIRIVLKFDDIDTEATFKKSYRNIVNVKESRNYQYNPESNHSSVEWLEEETKDANLTSKVYDLWLFRFIRYNIQPSHCKTKNY